MRWIIEVGLVSAYLFSIVSLNLSVKSWQDTEIKTVNSPEDDCDNNGDSSPKSSALVEFFSRLISPFSAISFVWFVAFIVIR